MQALLLSRHSPLRANCRCITQDQESLVVATAATGHCHYSGGWMSYYGALIIPHKKRVHNNNNKREACCWWFSWKRENLIEAFVRLSTVVLGNQILLGEGN